MMENNYFDELLEETIEEIVCEEFLAIEDYIGEHGAHIFSETAEQKMDKLMHKGKAMPDNKTPFEGKGKRRSRFRWKYAMVAVLLLGMCTMTVLAVEPIREKVKNIVYTIFPDHLLLEANPEYLEESSAVEDITTIEWMEPTYVPEGYELIDYYRDETFQDSCFTYENEDGKLLRYYQYDVAMRTLVTSDGETMKEVMVGDYVATMTIDESGKKVIFYNDKHWIFMVTGEEDEAELIKILESIN